MTPADAFFLVEDHTGLSMDVRSEMNKQFAQAWDEVALLAERREGC